jgi:hypothetical protein
MDNVWVYAGAGFVGFLWGMGSIAGTVAVAFMVGLWLGNSGAAQWAVLALIVGYVVGQIFTARRGA